MSGIKRAFVPGCALLIASFAMGCSNPYQQAIVRGRVTCDGKPVPGAVIKFQPLDAPQQTGRPSGHTGSASSGTVNEDGTFTLTSLDGVSGEGALIGPHMVIFEPPPTTKPTLTADERELMSPEEIKKWEEEFSRRPVYPPLACSNVISPAEVEVKPGENEFVFTLQPK
jgi:hypothetical protein